MLRAAPACVLGLLAVACRPEAPILTYHSVVAPGGAQATHKAGDDRYRLPEQQLAQQLDALKAAGFATVTLHELLAHQDAGAPLPPRPVVLTFDDGYEDAYTRVLPLLRARGQRATFFVVAGWVGSDAAHRHVGPEGTRFLVWPEVKALAAAGMEIGSHGLTHRKLPELSEQEVRGELAHSRQVLERGLGSPVDLIAYPFNGSRWWIRGAAEEAGYRAGLAGDGGGSRRFNLRRIAVYPGTSPAELVRELGR